MSRTSVPLELAVKAVTLMGERLEQHLSTTKSEMFAGRKISVCSGDI